LDYFWEIYIWLTLHKNPIMRCVIWIQIIIFIDLKTNYATMWIRVYSFIASSLQLCKNGGHVMIHINVSTTFRKNRKQKLHSLATCLSIDMQSDTLIFTFWRIKCTLINVNKKDKIEWNVKSASLWKLKTLQENSCCYKFTTSTKFQKINNKKNIEW